MSKSAKKTSLTQKGIDRMKLPASGTIEMFDSGYDGLALRVGHGGTKSWTFFYRFGGKLKRMRLGVMPDMSLDDAHEAWRNARDAVKQGKDPGAAPAPVGPAVAAAELEANANGTFKAIFEDWFAIDQKGNKGRKEVERIIKRECFPLWQHRQMASITREEIADMLDVIAKRGAMAMSRRTQAHVHRLFRWAAGKARIPANPMTDLEKNGKEVKRRRSLSDEELRLAWRAASEISWPLGHATKLLILTLARRDEIGAMRWDELDLANNEIRLEGARFKNDEPQLIPLSSMARKIIEKLPRIEDSPFVFTTTVTTPISGWSRAKRCLDKQMLDYAQQRARKRGADSEDVKIAPWRVHDLRRTGATGLEKLGERLQVVEALLGHIQGSKAGVAGIYQTHNYREEKHLAVARWAEHVAKVVGEKVESKA